MGKADMNRNNPSLKELQAWMKWIVTDPRGVHEALTEQTPADIQHRERYLEPAPTARHLIAAEGELSIADRISVYAEAYFSRIVESLEIDFSRLRTVLGEFGFQKLIVDYLKAFPSKTFNINEVGRHLPAFIAEYRETETIDYLADLAFFEWKLIETFYAPKGKAFDVSSLNSLTEDDWEHLQLKIDPSVRIISSIWPLDQFWEMGAEGEPAEFKSAPIKNPYLLWRHQNVVRLSKSSPIEAEVLSDLNRGYTLSNCLERTASRSEEFAPGQNLEPIILELFSKWASNGVLSEVKPKKLHHS
jgi:hypothetical protein